MIDKIIKKLEEEKEWYNTHGENGDFKRGIIGSINKAINIVKQVAKENDNGWIMFTESLNDEGVMELNCPLPDEDEEIIVMDGKYVWLDTFLAEERGLYYLEGGNKLVTDVIAWQPLPKAIERKK